MPIYWRFFSHLVAVCMVYKFYVLFFGFPWQIFHSSCYMFSCNTTAVCHTVEYLCPLFCSLSVIHLVSIFCIWLWLFLSIATANCRLTISGGGSNLKVGEHMVSAEREPIRGSGGRARGQGAKPFWSWKVLGIICRKDRQYLPLYPTFESAEISPNIAYNQSRPMVHKKHTSCVREREQTELSHSQCIWCTKPHCPQSLHSNN